MSLYRTIFVLALHLCLARADVGAATGSGLPTALELFERTWSAADDFAIPVNVVFRYREIVYAEPSAVPDQASYEVWYRKSGDWRFNLTHHRDGTYFDRVVTPLDMWAMSPGSLTVLLPQRPAPKGRDYPAAEREITSTLRNLAFAGFDAGRLIGMEPRRAELGDGKWVGTASADDRLTVEIRGRPTPEGDRLLADSYTYVAAKSHPAAVGKAWTVSGWAYEELLSAWIARRIAERRPDGGLARELIFEGVESLDGALFDELTKAPELTISGIDPLRGTIHFDDVMNVAHYRHENLYPSPPETEGASSTQLPSPAADPKSASAVVFLSLAIALAYLAGRWRPLRRGKQRT